MVKYVIPSLILAGLSLVNGCFPDLETQMRNRERAKVELEKAGTRLEVARARRDADISATKLLSEQRNKDIRFESELKAIDHENELAEARRRTELRKLARESGIYLSKKGDIKKANYKTADSLLWHLFWANFKKKTVKLSKDAPVLVASFVDLDNLSESSAFGRVVAEQIASRFNQKDYATVELKLGSDIFIREGEGEFVLSRKMKEVGIKHRAQAVIVGTYSVGSERIYLTARVIDVSNGRVLASHDYSIPITHDVFKLLLKGKDRAQPYWF